VVSLSFDSDAEDDQNAPKYDCHTCLYSMILELFYFLYSLTYSQIWLSPIVDDCQPTYITNLEKKKTKKKKKKTEKKKKIKKK